MPFLLRAISKSRWLEVEWLEVGKGQANTLLDLRPFENKLSFWHIEGNKSNLNRVVAAITAGKDNLPEKFDYALFDQSLLEETSVRIEQTSGDSFHKEADENWHRDTTNLSADNVVEIVNIIVRHGQKVRLYEREITPILKEEVDSGSIDIASLKERLKQKGEREITRILKEEVDSGSIDIASLKEKLKQKWSSHWLEQLAS